MDNINQKSLFIGPSLNPNKILHKQSLIKKFGTYIHKYMNFKFLKEYRLYQASKWRYIENLNTFSNQKAS